MQGQRERKWKPLPLSTEGSVSAVLLTDFLRNLSHIKFLLVGLVKAVNTAVDLIVAHFGTSRDPGVKVGKEGDHERSMLRSKRLREDQGKASNDSLYFSTASTGKAGE